MFFFVYGTLKRGYGNNRLLQEAKFIGEAISVEDNYVMWGNGFPLLAIAPEKHLDAGQVKGEIWEVPDDAKQTIQNIDDLEGHPHWYERKERDFRMLQEGGGIIAWVYLQPTPNRLREYSTPVEGCLEWGNGGG